MPALFASHRCAGGDTLDSSCNSFRRSVVTVHSDVLLPFLSEAIMSGQQKIMQKISGK